MKKYFFFILALLTALIAITVNSYAIPVAMPPFLANLHGHNIPVLAITVGVMDTTRARSAFERLAYVIAQIQAKWPGTDLMVSRGQILTEQVIQNGVSTYLFDTWDKTLQSLNPKRPLVRGVKDNDVFLAIGLRLLIDSRTMTQSNVQVQTWPNPTFFAPSGATTSDLWSIYNGKWTFQVDRVVYIDGDTTRKFLKTPPFNSITSNDTGLVNTAYTDVDEFDGQRYYPLDPYPILSGRADITLRLDMVIYPSWNGAADTSDYATIENVMTFEFDGYVLKNAYKFVPFLNGNLDIDCATDVQAFKGDANVTP